MICPQCSSNNRDGAKFCDECGCFLAEAKVEVRENDELAHGDAQSSSLAGDVAPERVDDAAPARPDAAGTCSSRVEKAPARAFEATLDTAAETPDAVIRDALVEVRSLADTVPSIIDVPEVIPSQTASDIEAQSDARVCDAQERSCGEDDAEGVGAAVPGVEAAGSGASSEDGAGDVGSVAAEARAMFGAKEPASSHAGASAEITADLSGLERLVDSSYVPPSYAGRVGDTMELPVVGDDVRVQPQSFLAQPDKLEIRRRKRAQRKLEQEMAKRERELQKQGAVPASSSASAAVEAANAAGASGEIAAGKADPDARTPSDQDARKSDAQPSKDPSGEKSFRKPLAAGIAVVAVVLCAAVAIATYQMELWGGKTVPAVDGLSVADATSVLEEKGFAVEVVDEKSDGTEGIVLSSDPGASSRAPEGSTVVVSVSVARVVPEILGETELDARKAFEAEGLANVEYELVKSNETEGTVLSVSPEPGARVKANDPVKVQVAQSFTVPDVIDKTSAEAIALLEEEGYVVESVRFDAEDVPEGTVVDVDPAPGTKLNTGETVTISVAHNRAAELESLTRAFFIDAGTVTINGLSYQVSEVTSVSYSGNGTCAFSIVARPFETHTWMFGLGSETRYGNYETISGSIAWNDDNSIASTDPVMKQGA